MMLTTLPAQPTPLLSDEEMSDIFDAIRRGESGF